MRTQLLLAMLAVTPMLNGATVTFDIVPTDADPDQVVTTDELVITPISGSDDFEVRVLPAGQVPYEVYVTVTSDVGGGNDHAGLSFFSVSIATDFGIAQQPADGFGPGISGTFPVTQSLGSSVGDDILQVTGGQQSINTTFNVASTQRILLFDGMLLIPQVNLGVFTVEINELSSVANVFREAGFATSVGANIAAGQQITVRTTLDIDTDDGDDDGDGDGDEDGDGVGDGDGDGNGDGDDDGDDGESAVPLPTIPPTTAIVMAAGMMIAIGLAMLAAGPFGAMIMLVVAPVVALLAIMLGAA